MNDEAIRTLSGVALGAAITWIGLIVGFIAGRKIP